MTMTERQAREVSGLLDVMDDLASLRKDLAKIGFDFYICAQGKDECLHSAMTLPGASGLVFVDGAILELQKRLAGYGVIPDAAPEPR